MSNDRIGICTNSRMFPPPREFVAQANVKKADFDALNASAAARLRGLLGGARARASCCGTSRSRKTLDESNAPFYKWFDDGELNVSYNCLDRNLAERQRRQGRDHLRGRRRQGDEGHLPGAATSASAASPTG